VRRREGLNCSKGWIVESKSMVFEIASHKKSD
jgi:hypothetical protein